MVELVDRIICGDHVLTMNDSLETIRDGAVAIRDSQIVDVGSRESILSQWRAVSVIDGKGRAILPGLINTHTHAAMVLFRGLADDLPLKEWLEGHIWPAENRWLSHEFVNDAVELACLEMLKAGVTVYNDMYFFGNSAAEATKRMGMRAFLGKGVLDFPSVSARTTDEYLDNAERFISDWRNDELITPCVAPHATYTCCPETFAKSKRLAERYSVPLHIHLAETAWEVGEIKSRYGKRPVELLNSIGFLDETVLAAHCVWLTKGEIGILAKRKVNVAHCIESNLKLASGVSPVPHMLSAGVKVTFGTDGAASNNDLSILSEMSTAAKVHKAVARDTTVLDSKTAVLMATRWGAEALGLGGRIGSLQKGKTADLISINLRAPHLTPLYNVYSHIVYSAMASDIETVIINGKLLISEGRHTTQNEEEILEKALVWGEKIRRSNSCR